MSTHAGLAARIHRALADVNVVVNRLVILSDRARRDSDFAVVDALALNLQSLYTGMEQIFEAIAREVDEDLPAGPNWHRDLLDQMGAEIPGRRPAVIDDASRACLHEARAFRHVVRNVYSHNLNAETVSTLAARMIVCHPHVKQALESFAGLLSQSR